MKQTTKYVALDVHQSTSVASVREESGRVIARTILPTESTALVEFFGGMRGAIHVAFEEGTQAQWLHDLLLPVVDRVLVCDRRGTPHQGNKGDHVDADRLSDLLRRGGLRAVYHDRPHREVRKELARTYLNLVQDSTRVMLRLKALFRAETLYAELDVLQAIRPGRCSARSRSSAPSALRCSWRRCRRRGASARSAISGPTPASRW